MPRLVIISGCSGGGKSSLLALLRERGYAVVEEPGRRIVQAEMASGGTALPWQDMEAFLRRAIDMAVADRAKALASSAALSSRIVFFDRSLIDAAAALEELTGQPSLAALAAQHPYNRTVFMTPPWPEIFVSDAERRHDMASAIHEYERLLRAYASLGYETTILPKTSISARADFILSALGDE